MASVMPYRSKASRLRLHVSTLELAAGENNVFHQGPERDRTWEGLQVIALDSQVLQRDPNPDR